MPDKQSDLLTVEERFEEAGKGKQAKAKTVHSDFKKARTARILKDRTFLEQYKIYRFFAKPRKFPWRANIYVPMGHVNVVVKTARLLTAVMSSDPFFSPVARTAEFAQNEEPLRDLMVEQQEDMDFQIFLHDWFLDMYIFSLGIAKMYWRYDEEVEEVEEWVDRPVYAKINGELIPLRTEQVKQKTKKYSVTYDGPCAEVVNIFDFYADPEATNIKKARYVIHRIDATIDHLKRMVERGVYDAEAVKQIVRENATSSDGDSTEKDVIDTIEGGAGERHESNTVEILEYWTKGRKMVAGPNDTLLQDIPNPYKQIPFFDIKHLRNAHKFFGIGTNEPVTSVLEAVNDTHNIRFDNWKILVQKMFVASEGAVSNPADLVARPGAIVKVRPGYNVNEAVAELNKGNLPIEAYTEQDKLSQINEVSVGVSEPDAGGGRRSGSRETATSIRKQSAGVSTRFGVELILLEPALKDLLQFHHKLNRIFLHQSREIRRKGDAGITSEMVGPEDIIGNFKFKFELSPMQGNRELWLQRVLLLFQTLSENETTSMMVNWYELSRRLFKAADIRNPDAVLTPGGVPMLPLPVVEKMMMEQQAQAQQQMQSQGQGQGGAATNPAQGQMNAQMRMPQPTPKDMMRDMFAGAANG